MAVLQIKRLIPVWVQSPLRDRRRFGLFAINGSNGKRVGKSCGDVS
jgi:hypothetical protein